jgi:hypothetical protein
MVTNGRKSSTYTTGCEKVLNMSKEMNCALYFKRNDVAAAISKNELYDFLIDIVPREEATKTHKKKETVSEVQYIVTLPTSTGMGNTIQLPSMCR